MLHDDATPTPPPDHGSVLHRWFIQYNPLYLVSAALVLYGLTALSGTIAAEIQRGGGVLPQLGITAIAELYGWALVGGAALLVRLRLRRPALMLALLAAAFQADLTLHCPTAAYLGAWGVVGTAAWMASAIGRFLVLVWAMQLRLSTSARVLPIVGFGVVAWMPHVLRLVGPSALVPMVALTVFVVFAAGLWTRRSAESRIALDPWPMLVLRRARLAVWIGWAVMFLVHASFWLRATPRAVEVLALAIPAALLLATRVAEREGTVWLAVSVALAWTAIQAPQWLWIVCVMAAITLALTFMVASASERARLVPGVFACLYLAVWTLGWTGGPAPAHPWWLDMAAVLTAWALVRRGAPYAAIVPTVALGHWIVAERLIPMPSSESGRALAAIVGGFVLLGLSLVASVRFRRRFIVDHDA